jgi:hypothetical protein
MIALNHSFVAGVATSPPKEAHATLALVEHVRRRMRALPLVHEQLAMFDWGDGPLIQWANRMRADPERRRLVELLLTMLSGPFVEGRLAQGPVEPPIAALAGWLQSIIRTLLAAPSTPGTPTGLVSPSPTGGIEALTFTCSGSTISSWFDAASFDRAVAVASTGLNTLEVLRQAEARMGGRLVVLPSAVRSAQDWTLDCSAAALLGSLLGLEEYAAALSEGLPRERCAARYHARCGIEMSQESAATWKQPTRRRQRLFTAAAHGEQYFDMHAKPGNLTRVHVWVFVSQGVEPVIYLGHCGRHLD